MNEHPPQLQDLLTEAQSYHSFDAWLSQYLDIYL